MITMYYIVCQDDSFSSQFDGGYIWEPAESEALLKLRVGDTILHDVKGEIKAVSKVTQEWQTATAPGCMKEKYGTGHAGHVILCQGQMAEHPVAFQPDCGDSFCVISETEGINLVSSIK